MGFPTPSVAHHLRNTGSEDLVYLMGGESRDAEIADFPKLGKRMIKSGDKVEIYDIADAKPFRAIRLPLPFRGEGREEGEFDSRDQRLLEYAKAMRRGRVLRPQRKLWLELRAKRFEGAKFRRQVVVAATLRISPAGLQCSSSKSTATRTPNAPAMVQAEACFSNSGATASSGSRTPR